MKIPTACSVLLNFPSCIALALAVVEAPLANAQTVWTGPITNYVQSQPYTASDPNSEDQLTALVALTRGSSHGLFNMVDESSYTHDFSPQDTEWSYGTIDQYSSLTYTTWEQWNGGSGNVLSMLNQPAVVHLITDDIYISIEFTDWAAGRITAGGGFSYTRSTPAAAAPPTPEVSLTSPSGGAVFAAPANVHIGANASVVMGSVTNVSFFFGSTLLGSATVSPFAVTANNLSANSYALTAVATAAGLSTTSAVVNISVVNPVTVTNSAPKVANRQFTFSYNANPGLTYAVQTSSNLVNWVSLGTNVASSSSVQVTNAFVPANSQYYRVGLAPNP
jgi:hypothetical protein